MSRSNYFFNTINLCNLVYFLTLTQVCIENWTLIHYCLPCQNLLCVLSCGFFFFTKPYVHVLPTYIRESTDFTNKISRINDLADDVLPVTLDIVSLNTYIPCDDGGLKALNFFSPWPTSVPSDQFIFDTFSWIRIYLHFPIVDWNGIDILMM